MKKSLLILGAISFLTLSSNTNAQIAEGKSVSFKYEHDAILISRLYEGGVQLKQFAISEIAVTTNNISGVVSYTMKITLTQGLARGTRSVYATVVDTDGVTESDPSNILTLKVKPKAPWGFGLF
jgi:hypothetical protein